MKTHYLPLAVLLLHFILNLVSGYPPLNGNDNYLIGDNEYWNWNTRISRNAVTSIRHGGVYKIENTFNSLYLTARDGKDSPGLVVVKKWANHPNQLWEASKIDKGFILKPLLNEFNSITSQIDHHAHSYNTYHFKNAGNGNWLITNVVSSQCIASGGSKNLIKNAKCNPSDKAQKWKFHLSEKK